MARTASRRTLVRYGWSSLVLLMLWGILGDPTPDAAAGGFTIAGRPVPPQEVNFAGARHVTPTYRIPVQINHDAQAVAPLDLDIIDDVYRALLAQHGREPYVPAATLPVVFIADLKLRRFAEGPRRLLFGALEAEIKRQRDVYLAPTAIFITDAALADGDRLRADLRLGLGYLFNEEFYRAIVGLERAIPRPAE
jgi:hypothetical protein